MKLLILTQAIDRNNPVLGFFYSWVLEFAKHCEKVTVIALGVGEYDLPDIKVLSLGKETGRSRVKYLARFYRYIWQERKNYDVVFVHMNPEYVVLGGFFWLVLGKKIGLWCNHKSGNLWLNLAITFAHYLFYTSPFSYLAGRKLKKASQMPAGINTEKFKVESKKLKVKNSILSLGRISVIKNIHILIEAARILDKENYDFILDIYGEPVERANDLEYFEKIKKDAGELIQKGEIRLLGGVANEKTPGIFNKHELFINLTNSGSLDKTVLEAMACESLVLVSNCSYENILPPQFLFKENDAVDLAKKIKGIFTLANKEKESLGSQNRNYVVNNHSLILLAEKLFKF